ncbi:DoxX family membrane protein [Pedobacter sp. AW31-3R]|uniref:DoxX family membrane protein n=1 Tax=Pedobacter sp. AW31-3R TaxID=3445781 RepID=UPI003FA10CCE
MKNKITFLLSLLFGIMFINAGLNKFFNYMPVPDDLPGKMLKVMTAMMEIGWLIPLVAVAEILGGILIIIPKTRALGALIIFPVMVGIILMNTLIDTGGLPIALAFSAVLLWIIYDNRAKFLAVVRG